VVLVATADQSIRFVEAWTKTVPKSGTLVNDKLRTQLQHLNPLALKEQIEQQLKLVLNAKQARQAQS
jgi:hypothetical protein